MRGVFFFLFVLPFLGLNVQSLTYTPVSSWNITWLYITGTTDAAYILSVDVPDAANIGFLRCAICNGSSASVTGVQYLGAFERVWVSSSASANFNNWALGWPVNISVVCYQEGSPDLCNLLNANSYSPAPLWRIDPFQTYIEVPPVTVVVTSSTSASVKWIGPSVYNNFPTLSYTLYWSLDEDFESLVGTHTINIPPEQQTISPPNPNLQSYNVSGLETGKEYHFRVRAANNWYTTPNRTQKAIIGDRPGAPTGLTLTVNDTTSFNVDWTNGNTNGGEITESNLLCGLDGSVSLGVNTFRNITKGGKVNGFVTGKEYFCKVHVVNMFGTSDYSTVASKLLATAPSPPALSSVITTSQTTFLVSFSAGASNGAPILDYKVEVSTDELFVNPPPQQFVLTETGNKPITVAALTGTASVTYHFRVSARNSIGTSDPSVVKSAILYPAPSFQDNTIGTNSTHTVGSSPFGSKTLVLGDTLGGQWVYLNGTGFSAYGAPTISYEDAYGSTPCLNSFVEDENRIWCQLRAGSGTHHRFSVASGSVQGQGLSSDTISFPGPQITPRTLRRSGGTNAEPLPAERDTPELLLFEGKNFGPSPVGAQVKYGPTGNPNQFTCAIRSWSDTTIACETEQGAQQRNLHFTVNVKGQTATGTDTYNYPTTPGIWSVTGCPGTGCGTNATCGCPTSGGVTLTLRGENFTEPLSFRIRGSTCGNVRVDAAQKSAMCDLPEGTGINLQVSAMQGTFESVANLLSYALPVLTGACGCEMGCSGLALPINCSRTDGDVVMVTGTNLGASGATIFIAGTPCLKTELNVPHTSYNCTVPPGAGKDRVISLFQNAGEISVTQTVTLSYEVCPPGTYASGVDCLPCPVGTSNPLYDQPKCVACAVGRYQNVTGKTLCPACPDGTAQGSTGKTQCVACTPGLFAKFDDNLGSPTCNPCPPGTYTAAHATSVCSPCSGGKFQNETGETACKNCTAGQKPSPGSISCLECDSGYYNSIAGNPLGCPQAPDGTIALKVGGRGATTYSDCDKGTQSTSDHTSCVPCRPGFFGNTTRAQHCLECEPGYFTDVEFATVCSQCLGGTFNNYHAASICFGCDTGTYSKDAAASCIKCPIGYYGPVVNGTECIKCAEGSSSGLGFSNCTACGTGRYSNGSIPSALCDACEAGTYAQNLSSVKCDDCPAGRASKVASQLCTVCGVGYFSNSTRSADCLSCIPGFFTDQQEETYCKPCYAGYYASANASRICVGCAAGFYQPTTGGRSCPKCPAGRYTVDVATVECHECPEGQVANPNALGCLDLYYQTNAVKFFFLVMALCALGVIVGSYIGLIIYRDHRVIHHSQPLILWVMLFGFALVFLSVILYIWDQTNAMCVFRHVVLNLGVSIVIVPLTLKTWRLHRIFNRSKSDAIQTVVIKDWVLVAIFGVVLLYDIITFIAWAVTAPSTVWTLIGRCDSTAEPWIHAVLWWWKPVCCLYLAYLVYRVRDIDERFNEAWWIGISLYNAVVTIAIFAVLSYTLELTPRKWYIMFVVVIIYLGLSTWALIYWVKWYQIYRKDTENERMLGNAVANDIADAQEVIEEEKEDIKEEEQEKKKGLDPDKGDEQLGKLHKSREKKARELQKLLQIVERTKTRMKTDMTNVNRYTSELLALQQEIEYRKRMLEKKGIAVPPPASSSAAAAEDGGKAKTGASDYTSGAAGGAAGAAGSGSDDSEGPSGDENKSSDAYGDTGAGAAETDDAGGDKAPADGGYSGGMSSEDRSPSQDGEDTFVA